MKLKIKINDRNKTIRYNNRKVRTPCEHEVARKDLTLFKMAMKMAGVQDYYIINPDLQEIKQVEINPNKEVVIEELDKIETVKSESLEKEKSILDLLIENGD